MAALKASKQASSSTIKLFGTSFSNEWIIDSGASNHMSGNLGLFSHSRDISSLVGLPNDKSTTVIGSIFFVQFVFVLFKQIRSLFLMLGCYGIVV